MNEFERMVHLMRNAQKAYFEQRSYTRLRDAKVAEAAVDKYLSEKTKPVDAVQQKLM